MENIKQIIKYFFKFDIRNTQKMAMFSSDEFKNGMNYGKKD